MLFDVEQADCWFCNCLDPELSDSEKSDLWATLLIGSIRFPYLTRSTLDNLTRRVHKQGPNSTSAHFTARPRPPPPPLPLFTHTYNLALSHDYRARWNDQSTAGPSPRRMCHSILSPHAEPKRACNSVRLFTSLFDHFFIFNVTFETTREINLTRLPSFPSDY